MGPEKLAEVIEFFDLEVTGYNGSVLFRSECGYIQGVATPCPVILSDGNVTQYVGPYTTRSGWYLKWWTDGLTLSWANATLVHGKLHCLSLEEVCRAAKMLLDLRKRNAEIEQLRRARAARKRQYRSNR